MVTTVDVKVSLARGRLQEAILGDLSAAGFKVKWELRRLNIVWGSVAPDCVAALSNVEGVDTVELDRPVFPS